ncbi:MAG: putative toxin-antitoxin system toxin component, PIN family [Clostridiales bacterium]|nr:putative toxin-antitoxin system toxin component, PIN family [Clostridiales bacterium]
MQYLAVFDTNVLVSALLSKNDDSATVQVIRSMINGAIIPLYHKDILDEYEDVLRRERFHFREESISTLLHAIISFGIEVIPEQVNECFSDEDDIIFYEIVMAKEDDGAYLITGNKKHFPKKPYVVTPSEMMQIIQENKK